MLKPIPLHLNGEFFLKDTIQIEKWLRNENITVDVYASPLEISQVRVERVAKGIEVSGGSGTKVVATLFVDAINSVYPDLNIFVVKSRVTFEGFEYKVEAVKHVSGISDLHHLEVMLS